MANTRNFDEPKTVRKDKETSLGLHLDSIPELEAQLREFLGVESREIIQGALHYVDSTMIIGEKVPTLAAKPFTKLENPEEHNPVRVHVPAGSLILWTGRTPHTNEHPGAPSRIAWPCEYNVQVSSVDELLTALHTIGVAVWPSVITEPQRRKAIDGVIDDLRRAAPPGTPVHQLYPPGGISCMITKCYGLGNTHNAWKRRLTPVVKSIFAYYFGHDDLTLSADAFSWIPPRNAGETEPRRFCQFISWAPWGAMKYTEVSKKLKALRAGRSMCHDPLRLRSGGGPGHMSNPKKGKPGHWTTLYDPILPEHEYALGLREATRKRSAEEPASPANKRAYNEI